MEHHPEFVTKLQQYGVRYTRTMTPVDDPSSPIGRSYLHTYQVSSKEELETKLSTIPDLSYQWLDDGNIRVTTEAIPAIRLVSTTTVPDAQQPINHVYQYTFCNSIIAAYLGWQDSRNDRFQALLPIICIIIGYCIHGKKVILLRFKIN
jgi:hypothetical protein